MDEELKYKEFQQFASKSHSEWQEYLKGSPDSLIQEQI